MLHWLYHNGPCFTPRETYEFARLLGCYADLLAPVQRCSRSLVKAFKRDYVYVNQRPSAAAVNAQLSDWFAAYHEIHPHKGLGMRSPREYLRAVS
jgi:putative transposase